MQLSIIKNLKIKLANDKIFKANNYPEMNSKVFNTIEKNPIQRKEKFRVKDNLLKSNTISAILTYGFGKTIALNFANANIAGGAYILGGEAQEEALCRASLLYYTIKTQRKFYYKNRLHFIPTYTNTMIYSANVPIIRDNKGNLLENPKFCDFITSPAVNRYLSKLFFIPDKIIYKIMKERISNIIALAALKQPDLLILGAWGCGAFGNKREIIYPLFEEAINLYLPEKVKVIFADIKGIK